MISIYLLFQENTVCVLSVSVQDSKDPNVCQLAAHCISSNLFRL